MPDISFNYHGSSVKIMLQSDEYCYKKKKCSLNYVCSTDPSHPHLMQRPPQVGCLLRILNASSPFGLSYITAFPPWTLDN